MAEFGIFEECQMGKPTFRDGYEVNRIIAAREITSMIYEHRTGAGPHIVEGERT